ncbi:MAG: hypothetical protein Fur0043_14480 [Anaerolineales bacterium]
MRRLLCSPILSLSLLFLLAACNLPTRPDLSLEDQAATIVAATLQAQHLLATPTAPKAAEPPPSLPSPPTSTKTPTPTITPTYSTPLLKVNESTNCRSGPGQAFEILTTFNPGATVEIVGRYPQENYWIVKNPNGGTCWIWGEYSTATGSHWTVPSMTPPSPPTQSPPSPPGSLFYNFSCTLAGEVTTSLTWTDRANNEQGYRVYRNGTLVAELSPNSTAYLDTFIGTGGLITYGVSSFNAAGNSAQATISFSCE